MFRSASAHPSSFGKWPVSGHLGWIRGALGAILGIGCSALAGWMLTGGDAAALPWLVAPIGASAVLVFAVPASPLAQPWPVVGGDLISATIGFAVTALIGPGIAACALSVGLAIAAMSVARCLHPPGGACALLAPLGMGASGGFLWTLAINVALLVLVAWLYNHLTGHPWPHRPESPPPQKPAPGEAPTITPADVDAVLDDWNEVLDVDRDDLHLLIQAVERRAAVRAAAGSTQLPVQ